MAILIIHDNHFYNRNHTTLDDIWDPEYTTYYRLTKIFDLWQ